MTLPPGQHRVEGFPRFGTHLHRPAPAIPADPAIEIGGAGIESFSMSLTEFAALPRRELNADFHCVSGWSATDLRWEGAAFETFYRTVLAPGVQPGTTVTHVAFRALDGFRAVLHLEDALADDVLIADRLDGRPLDSDHGAPLRLVSPSQYGYMSTKHLCGIELRTSAPKRDVVGAPSAIARVGLSTLIKRDPRARVWKEERHPRVPARLLRPVYRALIGPIMFLSRRGSGERS